jgi:putative transposase
MRTSPAGNTPGRPPTRRCVQALVLRPARQNGSWGYRRVHGELATVGIHARCPHRVGDLEAAWIEPAPDRDHSTWPAFLRGQARAILACDFFTTTTLTGVTYHVFAVIEHTARRVLGATAHPTGAWVTQLARNLVMDLQDAGADTKYLIRDRDTRFTQAFDAVLIGEGIEILKCAVQTPRMNSITERWVQTCRHELLDRTLIWNHAHLPACPRASSKRSTTSTDPTAPRTARHPCAHDRNRSPNSNEI